MKKQRNSEEWKEIMLRVNKDPEKIRKTAEKHKGIKRSPETCKNISESLKSKIPYNIGKIYCYNPETLEKKLCFKEEIPEGLIKGSLKRKGEK